jgi:D-alanyl-D-alanine carboxypeptidase
MKRKLLIPMVLIIAAAGIIFWIKAQDKPSDNTPVKNSQPTTSNSTPNGFNKQQYSINTAGSPWWIVNKKRPLVKGYVPPNLIVPNVKLRLNPSAEQMHLDKTASAALEQLFAGASHAGFQLMLASGYRSEAYQTQLYNSYVAKDGQAAADRYSARPGTSEHQTGLALDVGRSDAKCELEGCFGDTPEGQWLAAHAQGYGFIIRYPNGKEKITGYEYEPWHIRYVGKDLATELYQNEQTMEEFFNLQ